MEIVYSLSGEEMLRANKYLLKKTSAKAIIGAYRVLYTLLTFFVLAWLLLIYRYSFELSTILGIVAALIVFLISPRIIKIGSNKKVTKQILSQQGKMYLSERKIVLTETSIQLSSNIRTSSTLYSAVTSVDEEEEMIYIKFVSEDYIYLPSRLFKFSEDKDHFITYISQHAAQAMNKTTT